MIAKPAAQCPDVAMKSTWICWSLLLCLCAHAADQKPVDHFRQLDEIWPTPNEIRRPSGAPGKAYWQQRADYSINIELDDAKQTLTGSETITYFNNSPDDLTYLWLQLDQNRYETDSHDWLTSTTADPNELSYQGFKGFLYREKFQGGFKISSVKNAAGRPLKHALIHTMLRIHLPQPLKKGERFAFSIDWKFNIPDAKSIRVRGGYEYFEKDKNYSYAIAQWYPRMCAYTDVHGWQNKQTLGSEFTLEFGDYDVRITAPDDHIVASTGELQNPGEVLTAVQRKRLQQSRTAKKPVMIVTQKEATANQSTKPKGRKTWHFKAKRVRDFAFASSRKFLWNAQGFKLGKRTIMAMSYWPPEGEPLWSKYSTEAVVHTIKTYSKFTFDYPYPVIISVNGPIPGMEYPMITFQNPRPEEDGTYSKKTKYGLIGVIIHEVGHNWFPMVVNSDERRWRWMDEGLNSFVQFLAEQEWEEDYPSRILDPSRRAPFLGYLQRVNKMPIMTTADSLISGGYNAYSKPTLALSILRESILGRENFDFAFQQYARRWMFKRPTPYDLFRTMEDASGQDLDWFWRGWFYSTDHVDIAVKKFTRYRLDTLNPEIEKAEKRKQRAALPTPVIREKNRPIEKLAEHNPALKDFYNDHDDLAVLPGDRESYTKLLKGLKPEEKQLLQTKGNFYLVEFENIGGIVMPLFLKIEHTDGTHRSLRLPAEIWRYGSSDLARFIVSKKEIRSIEFDPQDELADVNRENNVFPRRPETKTFRLQKTPKAKNAMQKANAAKKKKK
ncbi:MAG: M1 family metallopeptidase [Limisphaerales bacterium]